MVGRPKNPTVASLTEQLATLTYDLRQCLPGFEELGDVAEETATRAAEMSVSGEPGAARLARVLTQDPGELPSVSLADPGYWLLLRLVIANYLLCCIYKAEDAGQDVRAVTILYLGHVIAGDRLLEVNPKTLTEWLRRLVAQHLPEKPNGWLYAQIHGEFDPTTSAYILHFHTIAAGDYLAALDGPVRAELKRRNQRLVGRHPGLPMVRVRVAVRKDKLRDPPRQVAYVAQGWWPRRPLVMTPDGWKRTRKKHRIREPHHSRYLLWLDKHTYTDMRLRMGMGSGGWS